MKLYLDDVRTPRSPEDWTIVRSVAEAKHVLENTTELVSAMSLDHDLGEDENGKELPSGLDFLKWVKETDRWPLTRPIIHSANPAGGQRMRDFVADYGPYGAQ